MVRFSMLFVLSNLNGARILQRSFSSYPLRIERTSPVSSTQRQIGPTLSNDQQSAIPPARLTRPNVGLKPVVPHR